MSLRPDILIMCDKALLDKKGTVPELKNRLVCNFLTNATAHQIVNYKSTEVWQVEKAATTKGDKKQDG